jgi:hypothetical protein
MNPKAKNDDLFAGDEYNEIEIGRMTEGEYERANQSFQAFLEQEQEERGLLEREFADELEQLFAMLRKNRADPNADPPGWPDF